MAKRYRIFTNHNTNETVHYEIKSLRPGQQSNIKFRKRILAAIDSGVKFRSFLTLTYNKNHIDGAGCNHVHEFINKLRRYYAHRNIKVSYAWQVDEGYKNGRVHYHMMLSLKYIPKNMIDKWWDKGYTWVTKINDDVHAAEYVAKYMSKTSDRPAAELGGKRYGCSQDIPPDPSSDWDYIGTY